MRDLRETAEAQHEITVLRQQIERDIEDLKESIRESDFALKSRNIGTPAISSSADETADELTAVMDKLAEDVSSKFQIAELELRSAREELNSIQSVVAEKSGLLGRDQQLVHSKRGRLLDLSNDSGIQKVENLMSELRQFEASIGLATPPSLNETKPKELLAYLEERLEAEEAESLEGMQPEMVRKVLKKLKSLVSHIETINQSVIYSCFINTMLSPSGQTREQDSGVSMLRQRNGRRIGQNFY